MQKSMQNVSVLHAENCFEHPESKARWNTHLSLPKSACKLCKLQRPYTSHMLNSSLSVRQGTTFFFFFSLVSSSSFTSSIFSSSSSSFGVSSYKFTCSQYPSRQHPRILIKECSHSFIIVKQQNISYYNKKWYIQAFQGQTKSVLVKIMWRCRYNNAEVQLQLM